MNFKNINIPERMKHYNVSGLSIAVIDKSVIQDALDYLNREQIKL